MKKRTAVGVFLTGTQSDLTFCMGRQWRKPLPACSFSVLIFCAYDTCVCAAICCTTISREGMKWTSALSASSADMALSTTPMSR